jgi:hypothetical protein
LLTLLASGLAFFIRSPAVALISVDRQKESETFCVGVKRITFLVDLGRHACGILPAAFGVRFVFELLRMGTLEPRRRRGPILQKQAGTKQVDVEVEERRRWALSEETNQILDRMPTGIGSGS